MQVHMSVAIKLCFEEKEKYTFESVSFHVVDATIKRKRRVSNGRDESSEEYIYIYLMVDDETDTVASNPALRYYMCVQSFLRSKDCDLKVSFPPVFLECCCG